MRGVDVDLPLGAGGSAPAVSGVFAAARRAGPDRGAPSQTLLEWYGAELVCRRGHGLLHRAEAMTSYMGRPGWHHLDDSWRGLFANSAGERR